MNRSDSSHDASLHHDASLIATSRRMLHVLSLVDRLASKDVTVLLTGETGTGKELVASRIHEQSRRAARPLVRFNCAAIPRELVESELFGHVRGAFTGASNSRHGFFCAADGGTLVIDEVESLPIEAQPKLLRALQGGEIQTIGADRPTVVDVRIIACTNQDLAALVAKGQFREDLFHRLAVARVVLPPLRERMDEIPALVEHFAHLYAERFGVAPMRISPDLLEELWMRPWTGNIRELENTVAAMVAHAEGDLLDSALLHSLEESQPSNDAPPSSPMPTGVGTFNEQVAALERRLLHEALLACDNNRSKAARRLGLSRTTFLGLIQRHGLDGAGASSQRRKPARKHASTVYALTEQTYGAHWTIARRSTSEGPN